MHDGILKNWKISIFGSVVAAGKICNDIVQESIVTTRQPIER